MTINVNIDLSQLSYSDLITEIKKRDAREMWWSLSDRINGKSRYETVEVLESEHLDWAVLSYKDGRTELVVPFGTESLRITFDGDGNAYPVWVREINVHMTDRPADYDDEHRYDDYDPLPF